MIIPCPVIFNTFFDFFKHISIKLPPTWATLNHMCALGFLVYHEAMGQLAFHLCRVGFCAVFPEQTFFSLLLFLFLLHPDLFERQGFLERRSDLLSEGL